MEEPKEAKTDKKDVVVPKPIKKTTDLIKLKLDNLMSNYEKPVVIPERPKGKQAPAVPEFVRNVMGSSAGAGSGEFHVYRHLRRKEYARQKFIQQKSESELKDEEYQRKLEESKRIAAEITAKKRAKRQKRKLSKKLKKEKNLGTDSTTQAESNSDTDDGTNPKTDNSIKTESGSDDE